jgi:hypothetical protein
VKFQIMMLIAATAISSSAPAQVRKNATASTAVKPSRSSKTAAPSSATSEKQFALDVLRSATALPQPDPQDRLRVLSAAITVVSQLSPAMARQWSKEGAQVEAELISNGQKPDVSVLALGSVDCKTSADFADRLSATNVPVAEQALIGIASSCGPSAKNSVRSKVEAAMQQNIVAPRLIMALMDALGPKTSWSQQMFTRMFSALPDPKDNTAEAPNFAAMYASMAPQVDKETARDAGMKLLVWLGKVNEGNQRNLAVNVTTDAMKSTLGAEAYQQALERDVMARQVAETAGQPGEVDHPEEESASVLQAIQSHKAGDQSESLRDLPPSQRARQAAALGFAAGTGGDPQAAERYFDVAFSATDEAWSQRSDVQNAPSMVSEVCDAAAQVNSLKALARAQKLSDPTAQAIGMISVARVVASKGSQ